MQGFPIKSVNVSAFTIPTDAPEADGTYSWSKTTIVIAEIEAGGKVGIGYTYADLATAKLIQDLLAPEVMGRDALNIPEIWQRMVWAIRNQGRAGICSMAISAVDNALWDLKAKLLGVPLVGLLGAVRSEAPLYGSGGFTSYSIDQLKKQLSGWVAKGFKRVKMKIGGDPETEAKRIGTAREAIGDGVELFVDANGAYTPKEALYVAEAFERFHVSWFEEPVSSDDLEGLRFVRERVYPEIKIAAGEYGYGSGYFDRMLRSQAVDILQVDATRSGGITGFLAAAALSYARGVPISAHCAPALHMHLGCAVPGFVHLEYFHDHARIERMLFDGLPEPVKGSLRPDLSRPGLGIALKKKDAERFAA